MTFKVVSVNVNGIRAAARKGFFEWLANENADVVCLQEVRAQADQLDTPEFQPEGYHCYYRQAQKKGYSGVAIFSKQKPKKVVEQVGYPLADEEGRYIHIEMNSLIIASLYFPSGTSGDVRQDHKYDFMAWYHQLMLKQKNSRKKLILCGDWNIAHKKIDIKNWRANQKNSGFLPEERAWLDELFDKDGFVDAFRVVNQEPDQYTWWSNRGRAWDNNVGWRIDYQIVTPNLKDTVKRVDIYKAQRFSDHAPLIVEYDLEL